jgi:hypothetical protein
MNVGIQGTRTFDDYNVFLRALRVALSDFDQENDNEFIIYSAGPAKINSFAMGFINITENSMKSRGIKTRVIKLPPQTLKQSIHDMDYFAFFSQPKEGTSDLVREAEDKDVEVGIFRY